jgi:uncharacterized protein
MTRGQKGCFVYSVDPETNQYFKDSAFGVAQYEVELVQDPGKRRFIDLVPVYSFEVAAGLFGRPDPVDCIGWMKIPQGIKVDSRHFVAKVGGKSMEPNIKDGSFCLFRHGIVGSREGKIVLAQLNTVSDPETGGQYTVKRYTSTKVWNKDHEWQHASVKLLPINTQFSHIEIEEAAADDVRIIAEFVMMIT